MDIVASPDIDEKATRVESLADEFCDRGLEPPSADVDAGDAGPFAAEPRCDRQADAPRGAGDDADPVLQSGAHALARVKASPNDFANSRS
jgi:hypothetical protein